MGLRLRPLNYLNSSDNPLPQLNSSNSRTTLRVKNALWNNVVGIIFKFDTLLQSVYTINRRLDPRLPAAGPCPSSLKPFPHAAVPTISHLLAFTLHYYTF